jgi:isovaleryl-CoA dehydrogenase
MRGSETGELVFEDCEVPAENLVRNEGEGVYILMRGLDSERLILSAGALGIHQRAMDEAMQYTTDRKQFGKPLNEQQIVQMKLADMYCDLQATRSMLY